MSTLTLACGPYFDMVGLGLSAGLLLVAKPLTYGLFVGAFRYRVNAPEPLNHSRVIAIVALRVLAGIVGLVIGFVALRALGAGENLPAAWALLMVERLAAWGIIGWRWARLGGRRLLGWTISGVCIDVAFDGAIAAGVGGEYYWASLLGAALCAFLIPLRLIGRRDSLRARFAKADRCFNCDYDLTGLNSSLCPECGRMRVVSAG